MIIEKSDTKLAYDDPNGDSFLDGYDSDEDIPPPAYQSEKGDIVEKGLPPTPKFPEPDSAVSTASNRIFIDTHRENIVGTYNIDPTLTGVEGDAYLARGKRKSRNTLPLNASFRSKRGLCKLNLATAGCTTEVGKANIFVGTRRGNIMINLFSLQAEKRINLDVYSRRGNTALLIPRSFRGALQLRSRQGALVFLPALTSIMRVLKRTDDEALILVGDTNLATGGSAPTQDDYCQLTSRHGKITVGLSGEDVLVAEVSAWKKLGEFLRGSSSQSQPEVPDAPAT